MVKTCLVNPLEGLENVCHRLAALDRAISALDWQKTSPEEYREIIDSILKTARRLDNTIPMV